MYILCTYVPETHVEVVKKAMFSKGAGHIGNYSDCCFTFKGEGQFKPLEDSSAFIGEINKIEKVSEVKIELVVKDAYIKDVIKALKKAHPYEEVAYHVLKMENL